MVLPSNPGSWVILRSAALWAAVGLAFGCGHSIGRGLATNHPAGFDFRHPACQPAPPADLALEDEVVVRYLGVGGLYIGWRGHAILTGPFFSNPGLLRVGLGRMRPDRRAIARGLAGVPMERVGAILVGHSHYDHLGDIPVVAEEFARRARILVNRSGEATLAPYPELSERVQVIEPMVGAWSLLAEAGGRPLPFRVYPVPSEHAPHAGSVTVMDGESAVLDRPWERARYWALRTGRTHSFVIDLLDAPEAEAPVRFRIFYQDSASPASAEQLPTDRPYDLAVLCAASADLVPPYPKLVLRRARPRHALVTHYENFFADWGPGRRFVVRLTDSRMRAFLRRVEDGLRDGGAAPLGPVASVCGPSSPGWTIPLVGEWIAFSPSDTDGPESAPAP